eukprot:359925-Chlamydomonas_euryale.AAC.1
MPPMRSSNGEKPAAHTKKGACSGGRMHDGRSGGMRACTRACVHPCMRVCRYVRMCDCHMRLTPAVVYVPPTSDCMLA